MAYGKARERSASPAPKLSPDQVNSIECSGLDKMNQYESRRSSAEKVPKVNVVTHEQQMLARL